MQGLVNPLVLAQPKGHQALWQALGQRLGEAGSAGCLEMEQPIGDRRVGEGVDFEGLARQPSVGNLQYGRTRQAFVGEQNVVLE